MDTVVTIPQLFVIAGLLLVLAELLVGIQTGFDLVLIGSILFVSGFVGMFTNVPLMLVLASALSILYIAVGRNKIRQKVAVVTKKTNIDKLVGATGTVVRSVTPDTAGLVRVNDEDWRASAEEILYERDAIVVEGIEGVTLIVRKLSK
ncbi:MAG: NfeD family protein [Candidatus Promineofilum sp.]|nr:NfeD family protein [Promineifilum sp.]MCW5862967.1 NfeD family protein [Anaerolineae bacterium]